MLAMKLALDQIGKRSTMFLCGTAAVPFEYRFMPLADLVRGEPDKLLGRPLLALDAANENRMGADQRLRTEAPFVAVIDHHHDNSRFGNVNLVVAEASSTSDVLRDVFAELKVRLTPEIAEALYIALVTDTGRFQYANTSPKTLRLAAEASSTSEVLQDVFAELKVRLTPEIAEALYIAMVTDTGRFQYANTSTKTLRLAAELIEDGADAHRIFQHVYETIEL